MPHTSSIDSPSHLSECNEDSAQEKHRGGDAVDYALTAAVEEAPKAQSGNTIERDDHSHDDDERETENQVVLHVHVREVDDAGQKCNVEADGYRIGHGEHDSEGKTVCSAGGPRVRRYPGGPPLFRGEIAEVNRTGPSDDAKHRFVGRRGGRETCNCHAEESQLSNNDAGGQTGHAPRPGVEGSSHDRDDLWARGCSRRRERRGEQGDIDDADHRLSLLTSVGVRRGVDVIGKG